MTLTVPVQRLIGAILRGDCSGPKFLEGGDYAAGWAKDCGIQPQELDGVYDLLWVMWTASAATSNTNTSGGF